jgi:hypothetical protein
MFPLSIEGAIDVPIDGADAALDRVKIAAVAAGAKSVERQPCRLVFYGRLPWAMSWNPLFSFDYCEISSESGKIRYSCSTRYLFILVTVMVLAFGLIILSHEPKIPVVRLVVVPVVAWMWLFGGNYFLGLARFRNFLSKAVRGRKGG